MKMKVIEKYSVLILSAGLLIGTASAQQSDSVEYNISQQSRLYIDGTSTLHNFKIEAKRIEGNAIIANGGVQNTKDIKITLLKVVIPVQKLDTDNESMNSNMSKSLKAEKNPDITYMLNDLYAVKLSGNASKPDTINTTGMLSIAGISKNIQMNVAGYLSNDGTLHFSGEKKINMVDYGIAPPTMFFGTIKVGKEVVVHFDLVLQQQKQLIGRK